jgi:CRISPR-associated protein Cas1
MQQIVEIAEDGRQLSLMRGFLKISDGDEELTRLPLDGIHAILMNCYRANLSQNILLECTERGIPVILCATNHQPAGILWPVVTHHKQAGVLQTQLNASRPLSKQLWQQLVKAKILMQHDALVTHHPSAGDALEGMAGRVRSGDPDNLEAQAARRYWKLLMGKEFKRDVDAEGANSMLNYGYAILRSTVARAVMACGLHPSLGLHHANRLNAFCLVDDLMEPFRPLVDHQVMGLLKDGHEGVTRQVKQRLAALVEDDVVMMGNERTTLGKATLRTVQSLSQSFAVGKVQLILPISVR